MVFVGAGFYDCHKPDRERTNFDEHTTAMNVLSRARVVYTTRSDIPSFPVVVEQEGDYVQIYLHPEAKKHDLHGGNLEHIVIANSKHADIEYLSTYDDRIQVELRLTDSEILPEYQGTFRYEIFFEAKR
jgi:hypothetical protein